MIGRIYALARVIIIYLGPLDPGAEQMITGNSSEPRPLSQISSGPQVGCLILSKVWFRRVWVFQELMFSREPWVQYGKHRWSWDAVHSFLQEQKQYIFQSLDNPSVTETENRSSQSVSLILERIFEGYHILSEMQLARERYRKKDELTLISLLPARRGLGITDLRGMVYAHIGFASDGPHKDW
jgi:hypothetical protein